MKLQYVSILFKTCQKNETFNTLGRNIKFNIVAKTSTYVLQRFLKLAC